MADRMTITNMRVYDLLNRGYGPYKRKYSEDTMQKLKSACYTFIGDIPEGEHIKLSWVFNNLSADDAELKPEDYWLDRLYSLYVEHEEWIGKQKRDEVVEPIMPTIPADSGISAEVTPHAVIEAEKEIESDKTRISTLESKYNAYCRELAYIQSDLYKYRSKLENDYELYEQVKNLPKDNVSCSSMIEKHLELITAKGWHPLMSYVREEPVTYGATNKAKALFNSTVNTRLSDASIIGKFYKSIGKENFESNEAFTARAKEIINSFPYVFDVYTVFVTNVTVMTHQDTRATMEIMPLMLKLNSTYDHEGNVWIHSLQPMSFGDLTPHPHVSDAYVCFGDEHLDGTLENLLDTFDKILRFYNPASPYITWSDYSESCMNVEEIRGNVSQSVRFFTNRVSQLASIMNNVKHRVRDRLIYGYWHEFDFSALFGRSLWDNLHKIRSNERITYNFVNYMDDLFNNLGDVDITSYKYMNVNRDYSNRLNDASYFRDALNLIEEPYFVNIHLTCAIPNQWRRFAKLFKDYKAFPTLYALTRFMQDSFRLHSELSTKMLRWNVDSLVRDTIHRGYKSYFKNGLVDLYNMDEDFADYFRKGVDTIAGYYEDSYGIGSYITDFEQWAKEKRYIDILKDYSLEFGLLRHIDLETGELIYHLRITLGSGSYDKPMKIVYRLDADTFIRWVRTILEKEIE